MYVQRESGFSCEAGEFRFELRKRVPIAGDQQHHGKLVAEASHATFADIAAAVADDFGEIVDETCAVGADGRDGEMLFWIKQCINPISATGHLK